MDFNKTEEDGKTKVSKSIKSDFSTGEMVDVTFNQNRSFELHIGRNIYKFEGRKTIKMAKSLINHPDFTLDLKKYFHIASITK